MAEITLVNAKIMDGHRLLGRLWEVGFPVQAAGWLRPLNEERQSLVIVTRMVDEQGPAAAYSSVYRVLRDLGKVQLTDSEIRLVGVGHSLARLLVAAQDRMTGKLVTPYAQYDYGGVFVEELYVYRPYVDKPPHLMLGEGQKQLLVDIYKRYTLPVDELPYTEEMEQIYLRFWEECGLNMTIGDVFIALKSLEREGRLERKATAQPQGSTGH